MIHSKFSEKEKNILRHIFSLQETTRQELCRYTHYSLPTIYRIIDDLLHRNILTVSGIDEEPTKGRPTEKINITSDIGIILCIHIDRTEYTAALTDFNLNILQKKSHIFAKETRPETVIYNIEADYKIMMSELNIGDEHISGIGVSLVGPIDYKNNCMLQPIYFQAGNWTGVPIIQIIQKHFNKPAEYNCNASACLQGHYFRNLYKSYKNVAYITLGTGIGSGLILNRKLHMHKIILDGLAHMIIDLNGRKCYCGSYGCVESYVSKYAILEDCRQVLKIGQNSCMKRHIDTLTISDIAEAIEQEDELAKSIIQKAAAVFACCLSNYLRITDLEAVILGGSLIEHIPFFFQTIVSCIKEKNICDIDLIQGADEKANILKGIAAQFILNTILK